jgi:tRNA(Ile)-lysidine synthetase-like protein
LTVNWDKPIYPNHPKNSSTNDYFPTGSKMETAARSERYSLLGTAMTKDHIDTVILGHHANDLQETTLFRISRHSGVVGLAGIHTLSAFPVALHKSWTNYTLIRPLLDISKTRLIDTCKEYGIKWEEDPSNTITTGLIQRNVIREILNSVNQADCPEGLKALQFDNFQKFCNNMDAHQVNIMKRTNDAIEKYVTFNPKYGLCQIDYKNAPWKQSFHFAARVLSKLNQWVRCGNNSPRLNTIRNAVEYFMDPTTIKSNKSNQHLVQLAGTILIFTPKKERLILIREPLTQTCRAKNTFIVPLPVGGKPSSFEAFFDDRYFINVKIQKHYLLDPKLLMWCKMTYPMLTNLSDIEHTVKLRSFDHDLHSDRLIRLLRIYKLKLSDPKVTSTIKQFYRTNRESLELIPVKSARTTIPVIVIELKGELDGVKFEKEVVVGFPTLGINFLPTSFLIRSEDKFRSYKGMGNDRLLLNLENAEN